MRPDPVEHVSCVQVRLLSTEQPVNPVSSPSTSDAVHRRAPKASQNFSAAAKVIGAGQTPLTSARGSSWSRHRCTWVRGVSVGRWCTAGPGKAPHPHTSMKGQVGMPLVQEKKGESPPHSPHSIPHSPPATPMVVRKGRTLGVGAHAEAGNAAAPSKRGAAGARWRHRGAGASGIAIVASEASFAAAPGGEFGWGLLVSPACSCVKNVNEYDDWGEKGRGCHL